MHTKTIQLRVDRIEDGIAVAYAADGAEYCTCAKATGIEENDILLAIVDANGNITDVTVLPEETEKVKQTLKSRLHSLFDR